MEVLDQIARHATERPDALAIRQADAPEGHERFCTWDELHDQAIALGVRLRGKLPRGAVVMLLCSNRPEFWIAYFGVLSAGLSIFPIAPDTVAAEVNTAASLTRAAAVIVESRLTASARVSFPTRAEAPELGGEFELRLAIAAPVPQPGPGLLLQSSGTTGHPKIVWRSAEALDAVAKGMVERIGFSPVDRVLTGMPLGHSYGGEHGVLAPAYAGSAVHVCSGVDLQTISREIVYAGITVLPGVPFLFEILSQANSDFAPLKQLRHTFSAGAQLPQGVHEAFVRRFGLSIGQIYGATEFGSITFNDPHQAGFDSMSVGLPLAGVELRIVHPEQPDLAHTLPSGMEGHLAVRAASMLSRVVGDETSPFTDGFVLTGDLARLDAQGKLTITGRLRLLIDVGGRKVNPIEVEQVLREHPQVSECVVVPIQVSQTVSRLKAVVIPKGEADAEAIRSFARERLTSYKVPRLIEFRQSLPRTPLGKILRHLV